MEIFCKQFYENFTVEETKMKYLEELDKCLSNKSWNTILTESEYEKLLTDYKLALGKDSKRTSHDYWILKKYEIMKVGDEESLIPKRRDVEALPLNIITKEKLFEVLIKAHYDTGHGRRDAMMKNTKVYYDGITIDCVNIFLKFCKQ